MRTLVIVFVFLSAPGLSVGAVAQSDLSEAKTQYEEAAYEDALTTLTKASASTPADRVQLEQYRALCLIALGRLPEAERAVVALVEADPTYVPPSSVASPPSTGRFRTTGRSMPIINMARMTGIRTAPMSASTRPSSSRWTR